MLLTVEEVAKELNISKPTVYRMIDSEELVFLKVGGSLRMDEKDLFKYVDSQKKKFADKKVNTFARNVKTKGLRIIK